MTNKTTLSLEAEIEQVVRKHLERQRQAAAAAVERGFAAAAMPRARPVAQPPGASRRRTPAEMSDTAERLYQVVRANPGQTMTFLAAKLGQTPHSLAWPMDHLKRSGCVRSAGQRNFTRYFPMGSARLA